MSAVKMLPNTRYIIVIAGLLVMAPSVSGSCTLECSDSWVSDCEVCHTVHIRDCTITMKTVMVPRKVEKCSPNRLTAWDGLVCNNGARMRCKVR